MGSVTLTGTCVDYGIGSLIGSNKYSGKDGCGGTIEACSKTKLCDKGGGCSCEYERYLLGDVGLCHPVNGSSKDFISFED